MLPNVSTTDSEQSGRFRRVRGSGPRELHCCPDAHEILLLTGGRTVCNGNRPGPVRA